MCSISGSSVWETRVLQMFLSECRRGLITLALAYVCASPFAASSQLVHSCWGQRALSYLARQGLASAPVLCLEQNKYGRGGPKRIISRDKPDRAAPSAAPCLSTNESCFCEDSSGMVIRDSVVRVNRETFVVVNRNSKLRVNRFFGGDARFWSKSIKIHQNRSKTIRIDQKRSLWSILIVLWSILIVFDRFWSFCDRFWSFCDGFWSFCYRFVMVFDRFWSFCDRFVIDFDRFWSILIKSDQKWSFFVVEEKKKGRFEMIKIDQNRSKTIKKHQKTSKKITRRPDSIKNDHFGVLWCFVMFFDVFWCFLIEFDRFWWSGGGHVMFCDVFWSTHHYIVTI